MGAAGQLGEIGANLAELTSISGGMFYGGYVTPFDLANIVLILCMLYISTRWSENYGESEGDTGSNFGKALSAVFGDKKILLCGLIASSFESSMFIFVFNWTPCLMEPNQPVPPFGHIFTGFMIMCLLGTRLYATLSSKIPVEKIGVYVVMVSMGCHLTVFLVENVVIRFIAFLVFEMAVGLYFPMIGTLKGDIVPEDMRSTIYNIYRFPLNIIVLMPLLMNFSISTTFMVTSAILLIAVVCAFMLSRMQKEPIEIADKNGPEVQELGKVHESAADGL